MTNFNERTNTLLYKNIISHTWFSKDLKLVVCERWAGDVDRLLYWPQLLLTIAALPPRLGWGCSNVGHWGSNALCLPLALNSASCPLVSNSNWLKPPVSWLYFCLTPTCFCSSSVYLHWCISWLTVRSRVNMLHHDRGFIVVIEYYFQIRHKKTRYYY